MLLKEIRPFLGLLLFGLFFSGFQSFGQDNSAQDLLDQATSAFDNGNFSEASGLFEEFTRKFSEHPQAPLARYLLGISEYSAGNYPQAIAALENDDGFPEEVMVSAGFHFGASQYFLGNYDKAIKAFRFASRPVEKKEGEESVAEEAESIRPFALFYLGRALMETGSSLEAEDNADEARKSWQEGIQTLDTMISDYPESPLLPDALMTRATLHAFMGNNDPAVADLERLKQLPEGQTMVEEADYLLGYVQSQKANALLADFKTDEAREMTQQARETYLRLIQSDNLVIANEAAFQLANLDFADQNYQAAIDSYRSVNGKEALIESQQQRLEALRRQISEAGGNPNRVTTLQRALKREEQKLNAVQANPELAKEALIKVGEVYMQMREYNLARVVFRHAMNFADSEQKKRLQVQVIISHAAQGNTEKAETLFAEFRSKFPGDPMAQNVKFLLGNAFLQQERYEEAIKAFDESIQEFPDGPGSAQIPKLKAQAYMGMGRKEEAMKSFRKFISEAESGKIKVAPSVVEDTRRLLAFALFAEKQIEEAIEILQDLSENAQTPSIKEAASLQLANFLSQAGKIDEAIEQFRAFAQNFPESANTSKALVQAGALLQKDNRLDEARTLYRSVIDQFSEDPMALLAYDRLWRTYKESDFEKMIEVQDELITAHPNSERSLAAVFDRARTLEQDRRDLAEAVASYLEVVEMENSMPAENRSEKTTQFASFALYSAAMIHQKQASALGRYTSLDDPGKNKWVGHIEQSRDLLRRTVLEFPEAKTQAIALRKLTDVLLNLIANDLMSQQDAVTFMSRLAGEMRSDAQRMKVLIAQAGLMNSLGQRGQALRIYDDAFAQADDASSISWQDLDTYGSLLLEGENYQRALEIYQKLADSVTEKQQHGLAAATYGQGAAYQGLGQSAQAEKFFKELQEKYPWSPKIMEAQYAAAETSFENGDHQKSINALKEIIQSTKSSNESKAKAMILMARNLKAMGDKNIPTEETRQEDGSDMDVYDLAANYLAKVEVFYADALPNLSAEALYESVKIFLSRGKTQEASENIDRLLDTYPTTPAARKAREEF